VGLLRSYLACFVPTAANKLRSFRPEVTAALTAPGVAAQARPALGCCGSRAQPLTHARTLAPRRGAQLRASVARCTPRLDAAGPLPRELEAMLAEARAAAGASSAPAAADADAAAAAAAAPPAGTGT
jgi:hypothetical protein